MMLKLDNSPNSKLIKDVQTKSVSLANNKTTIDIPLSEIDENPDNEKVFNLDDIESLAKNIKEEGFFGAIEVYKKDDGRYEISSGHRRYRAVLSLGHKTIPAIVTPMPDDIKRRRKLIASNMNMRNLSPIDKGRMIQYYYDTLMLEEGNENRVSRGQQSRKDIVAEYFNISSSQVMKYMALTKLIVPLQSLISDNKVPWTSFPSVANMEEDKQNLLYDLCNKELSVKSSLTAADVDKLIKGMSENNRNNSRKERPRKNEIDVLRNFSIKQYGKEDLTVILQILKDKIEECEILLNK